MPCVLDGNQGVFLGQQNTQGRPEGCIRFVNQYGEVFEGEAKNNGFNGWGRLFEYYGDCCIGYWKDSVLYGNSRIYDEDNKIRKEGWFNDGEYTCPFKKGSVQFKYWDKTNSIKGFKYFVPQKQ